MASPIPAPPAETPGGGFRARALLLGVAAVVLLAFVTVYGDMVVQQVQIGILQFAPPALAALFVLVLLNRLVKALLRRQVLGRQDLLPLYVMMTVAVLMCSRGTIEKLIPPLTYVNYYATPENKYMELFGPYLPDWLVVFDPQGDLKQGIANAYHQGNATVPWRHWLGPILSWTGLLTLVYVTFFCLSVVLRRQWADHEKLVFPLTALPLTLIGDDTAAPFLRNRLTWIGVAIPSAIYLLNGLHANIPAIPQITLRWQLNQFLTTRPWNGIYYTPVQISFGAVGFFYFLSSDLLLSLWVFFVLTRVTDVIGTQLGFEMTAMNQYPCRLYHGYQMAGAYTVLVLYLLYTGARHLGPVFHSALRRRPDLPDDGPDEEVLPYRVALWGCVLGFIGAVVWCCCAGLTVWLAVVELGVYLFVVALVLSRGVAEAGMLQTETSFRPLDLVRLFRDHWTLGPRNITILSLLDTVLTRDLRGVLLSNFLDSQKMAKELRFRPRSLILPTWLAIFTALVAGCWVFLQLNYTYGNITLYGYPRDNAQIQTIEAANALQQHLRTPVAALPSYLAGLAICGILVALRTTQVWWPLHPLGYAVSASWTLIVFWFSAFVTWGVKGFLLKSGGMKTYRRAMPLFLGLILGTFITATFWTVLALVGKVYHFTILAPSLGFD
ncbi:MAG: hypothetical protein HYU66_11705 [Armatimonadetes bacterium]|nr:hypothetical protein [Armatimonadota bacterium]